MLSRLVVIIIILFSLAGAIYSSTLSLGKINVVSGLDQKLKAYIEVKSFPKDSKVDWQVSGNAMGENLKGIRYFIKSQDGITQLLVTTDQPIHVPVITLNILAEENKEQLAADEYTILLDPTTKPVPIDLKQYGPVSKNETLSQVAKKVKPEYITLDNAKNALFYANPHAFENNDVNQMIPGSFLVIPEFSAGIKAIGSNSINNAKIIKIEEQIGLLSENIEESNKDTSQKYTELSAYTLQLEKLVTRLDSKISDLENGYAFISNDIQKQAKIQQEGIRSLSSQLQRNTQMIKKMQETSYEWLYYTFAVILFILLIFIFWWLRRRKQLQAAEEIDYLDNENNENDQASTETENQVNGNSVDDSSEMPLDNSGNNQIKEAETIADIEQEMEKNDKYHQHFLDEQKKNQIFLSDQDENDLRKTLESNNNPNQGEVQEDNNEGLLVDADNAVQSSSDEEIKEVDIVLDDESEDSVNEENEENEKKHHSEPDIQHKSNEFDLTSVDNNDLSLTDLESALAEQIKNNKDHDKEKTKLEPQIDKKDINLKEKSENDDDEIKGKQKSGGLKLSPLDLTKKDKE